jgi:5-methylcytosine-specific restriction protein B
MRKELFTKIDELFKKNPNFFRQRSGDDATLAKFQSQYPLDRLPSLTLEDYCLGAGCKPENFSWWIERGLQRALGRYMPGTSRGHLIYLKPDRSYDIHLKLADLGPQGALDIILRTVHTVAGFNSLEEAEVIDKRKELAKRVGIPESRLAGGDSRFLRLLAVYHPDWMIPINSADHIRHFLTQFSDELDPELPGKPVAATSQLHQLYEEIRKTVDADISPWGFTQFLYHKDLGIIPPKRPARGSVGDDNSPNEDAAPPIPLNQILYGPPGTGKTYSTVDRALGIIDPAFVLETEGHKDGRAKRKARYDELVAAKRIGFITFHQSFSYEDFVEGLKASTDDEGQIKYEVEDGVFKQIAGAAAAAMEGAREPMKLSELKLQGKRIWKMSLGNTQGPDAAVYEECLDKNVVLLGYGGDADLAGAQSREEMLERLRVHSPAVTESDYQVKACHLFVNRMKAGDLIVVSDGNYKFRAIGEITGDYAFIPADEDWDGFYQQSRPVRWLRTFNPSLSHDLIMNKIFSQQTIYELNPSVIDIHRLESLLVGGDAEMPKPSGTSPYVLIIDEINRGNISRIFGELITLIEDSKRQGEPEALKAKLPYSKVLFSVPQNLYLIGTMNTADRSLAQIDIALRRRFVFEELMPDPSLLNKVPVINGIQIDRMLSVMNQRIEMLYDREHTIGHTFFLSLREDPSLAELQRIFEGRILPLLEEYFFEDWEKIRLVLGDNQKPLEFAMVRPKFSEAHKNALFGVELEVPLSKAYERNFDALVSPEAYIGIYDPTSIVKAASASMS